MKVKYIFHGLWMPKNKKWLRNLYLKSFHDLIFLLLLTWIPSTSNLYYRIVFIQLFCLQTRFPWSRRWYIIHHFIKYSYRQSIKTQNFLLKMVLIFLAIEIDSVCFIMSNKKSNWTKNPAHLVASQEEAVISMCINHMVPHFL